MKVKQYQQVDQQPVVLEGDTGHRLRAGDVVFVQPNDVRQFRNTGERPMKFMVPNSATGQQVKVAPKCGTE